MGLMQGKKGIVFGLSNDKGLAYHIASKLYDQGADIAFSFAEPLRSRAELLASQMASKLCMPCDVTKEEDIKAFVEAYKSIYGSCDFVLHSVAYANREDLQGNISDLSLDGWNICMHVSAYSLISVARNIKPLMNQGGSILTMSYIGSQRSIYNYNIMGIAKAALESIVRYLSVEFGELDVRVNALSAGAIRTLAIRGISNSTLLLKASELISPRSKPLDHSEVGNSGLYLLSDLSTAVSGEVHYVDCGLGKVGISENQLNFLKD